MSPVADSTVDAISVDGDVSKFVIDVICVVGTVSTVVSVVVVDISAFRMYEDVW